MRDPEFLRDFLYEVRQQQEDEEQKTNFQNERQERNYELKQECCKVRSLDRFKL
jgi:hypothetical protein